MQDQIRGPWRGRAWVALGYESWDDYCRVEFADHMVRLPRAERVERVTQLRSVGMSTPDIASVVGVNQSTVSRDLSSGYANAYPGSPERVVGSDGKQYPATRTQPEPNRALYTSDSDDWWTPKAIVDRAVKALDGIDLDPRSNLREPPSRALMGAAHGDHPL